MKVKPSVFKKQLQEALKVFVLKHGNTEDHDEHEESETEEEEEAEHDKEDPRVEWQKTGKYIYDEAEEVDDDVLTTDKKPEPTGKYIFGDKEQETYTKLENDKINFSKSDEEKEEELEEAAPEGEGWEKIVKGIKKSGNVDNPWAVANAMKNKGIKPKKESIGEAAEKEEKNDFPLFDKKGRKDSNKAEEWKVAPAHMDIEKTDKEQEDIYKWALGYVFMKRNGKK